MISAQLTPATLWSVNLPLSNRINAGSAEPFVMVAQRIPTLFTFAKQKLPNKIRRDNLFEQSRGACAVAQAE
ncbi:MAG TPA: hypothetical protein V6C72_01965, partial [Chroococcales cyanobacterium]